MKNLHSLLKDRVLILLTTIVLGLAVFTFPIISASQDGIRSRSIDDLARSSHRSRSRSRSTSDLVFKSLQRATDSNEDDHRRADLSQKSTLVKGSNEAWAYVTVRPKAHMFYWVYNTTHSSGYKNRPLILWLQGGPGGSSVGFGNFGELGPLDTDLKPRNTTWLQTASLLFVDNPVGTGYSYVDDKSAYTTNLQEISRDLLTVMKEFVRDFPDFGSVPFYIFSESYGGKMTAGFSAVLSEAITKGEIKMNFQGFAMGDSWISPIDSTNSWGPYLYDTSIVSLSGLEVINAGAKKLEELVKNGNFTEATAQWGNLEGTVEEEGSGVNFYNIMDWPHSGLQQPGKTHRNHIEKLFDRHVKPMQNGNLDALMNGPIRKKLMIIPKNVRWGGQSGDVFQYQTGDFMKNVTSTVNELMNQDSLKVVIYSGQLDLICDILGTYSWFYSLDKAAMFKKVKEETFSCGPTVPVCFFGQKMKNLEFYRILNAGHMVPADNGPAALAMVNLIIE